MMRLLTALLVVITAAVAVGWQSAGPAADLAACRRTCASLWWPCALQTEGACSCGPAPCPPDQTTGARGPGPPRLVNISGLADTGVHLWWNEPEAHDIITSYKVVAEVVQTHSNNVLKPLEWIFSNNTFHTQLTNLHPGTVYNITISAVSPDGPGIASHAEIETVIGDPDPSPPSPIVIERRTTYMVIRIPKAVNYNGPVSRYRIVVINEDRQQGFLPEYLKPYEEASKDGLPYYIAAELDPFDIEYTFTIGDKKTYNGIYYNAPLTSSRDIQISIGIVSSKNGVTKIRYTHSSEVMILNVNEDEQASGPVMFLGVAVAIGFVLLIIGIGIVIVLRRKIGTNRRLRLTQSMVLSGPCIEIENAGFIADDEEKVDHYANLKRQLWNIPKNFLEVDGGSTTGMGNFGKFVQARVQQRGAVKAASVQTILDGELSVSERKQMLGELDALIKSDGHDNVISLIGICELSDVLYVVMEDTKHNLKEHLLSSRRKDIRDNKFSIVGESVIFQMLFGIAKGMEFLASKKILHKKLCCKNVILINGAVPKIGGFGLSHFYTADEKPDYTRWTAQEMFKQNNYYVKCDVWSFGCLIWEVLSLGGTLYPQVPSKDVPSRVMKGMRPAQISYIGDEIYQICLQCWQSDLDERPTFPQLRNMIEACNNKNYLGLLSFTYYNGFNYEPHIPELEILN